PSTLHVRGPLVLVLRLLAWPALPVSGRAGAPDDTRRRAVIPVCVATAIASSLLSEFGGPAIRPRELALVADVVGLSLLVRLSGGPESELRAAFPVLALAPFLVLDQRAALRVAAFDVAASVVAIALDLGF